MRLPSALIRTYRGRHTNAQSKPRRSGLDNLDSPQTPISSQERKLTKNAMRYSTPLPLGYCRLLARVAAERRVRRASASAIDLPSDVPLSFETEALCLFANLPLRARLANRFIDAMFAMEEALSMCEVERDESRDASWIEPQIQSTYEQVNALMEAVSD